MTTAITIPLAEIEPDETINARRTRTDEGIEELKASIRAHGLIQALRVRHDAASSKFKIIAGHRRHRVLCELATDGDAAAGVAVTPGYEVPVIIGDVDDRAARELSQAENLIRLPQHEADTYETFRELADRGLDESQIAARFGIDPKRVKRMLALGRLSPVILDWWRGQDQTNETVATVRAFTLAPSVNDQEKLFKKLSKQGEVRAWAVKRALGADNQEAAKAIKIAGLEAYKTAGGRVTQDLFGDNHVISDPDIAMAVAEQKIESVLAGLKAEGWSWASMANDLPYSWTYGWSKEKPSEGKMTSDEKKQIKKLEKAAAKGTAGAAHELAALQKAIAGRQWTPEQLAKAGAVLEVGYHGDLTITRGVLKPAAPKKAADDGRPKEKSAPTISNAIAHRLSAQATWATAAALAQEPRVGLIALLAGHLAAGHHGAPIRARTDGMGGRGAEEREGFGSAFGRLMAMSDSELMVVAAGIAARAVDVRVPHAGVKPFNATTSTLAAAIEPSFMAAAMREHWDASDYFNSVAKSFVITAIREAINEDEARKADKLKKKELVEFAVKNVPPTGWLPPELRAPTYSGPGAVPTYISDEISEDRPKNIGSGDWLDEDEIDEDLDEDEAA
ncbi:MAG: ParB/RepB/Spo0J family partition protein [Mesorhizobium sp.]|uniref:ParB/RepB/Spo0J family partition protein n=1 Tax=Mesorhizobium sp. TaxID=1871066 RepID=UPI00121D14BB|nr:ParB/RepB/Spo0J family partition protein [Mesorhizobium sp.]TJV51136.1 MAG: ParB/RepB/Spo0J family partition protein [Mesorhizobium sp.]